MFLTDIVGIYSYDIGSWHYDGLDSGETVVQVDVPYVFDSVETHGIHIYIRPDGWAEGEHCDANPENNQGLKWFEFLPSPWLTLCGYVYYIDRTSSNQLTPARGVAVELRDSDIGYTITDLLAVDTTDEYGYYEFVRVLNEEWPPGPLLDVFVRALAANFACTITETGDGDEPFECNSNIFDEQESGEWQLDFAAPSNESGAFYIADILLNASTRWEELTGHTVDKVTVDWSVENEGSYFDAPDTKLLHVERVDYSANLYPDTWDRGVILHEYGHFLEDTLAFFNQSPGGTHSWGESHSFPLASSEGGAWFIAAVLQDNPVIYNGADPAVSQWVAYDIETGKAEWWNGGCEVAGFTGYKQEASVAGALWDLWDGVNDDYHTLWRTIRSNSECGAIPDGIGDAVQVPPGFVWEVLLERTGLGHHPSDMFDFHYVWFSVWPSLGYDEELAAIWHEAGLGYYECCLGMRGNVDMEGTVTMSDLTTLIDHLFISYHPVSCVLAANIDSSPDSTSDVEWYDWHEVTMSDLTRLVDYLFITYDSLPPCPSKEYGGRDTILTALGEPLNDLGENGGLDR